MWMEEEEWELGPGYGKSWQAVKKGNKVIMRTLRDWTGGEFGPESTHSLETGQQETYEQISIID